MYFLEWIANDALVGVAAVTVLGEAGCKKKPAIEGGDPSRRGIVAPLGGQPVTAIGSMLRSQESVLDQLLQDLGKQGQRDAVHLGDLFGAGAFGPMNDEVLQGNKPVVGLLGKLQHCNPDLNGPSSLWTIRNM